METEFRLNAAQGLWPPPPLELVAVSAMPDEEIDLLIERMSSDGSVEIDRLIADALRLPFSTGVVDDGTSASRPRRWLRSVRRHLSGTSRGHNVSRAMRFSE